MLGPTREVITRLSLYFLDHFFDHLFDHRENVPLCQRQTRLLLAEEFVKKWEKKVNLYFYPVMYISE